jgi:hypothetical protein
VLKNPIEAVNGVQAGQLVIIAFTLANLTLEASPVFAAYQRCLSIHGSRVSLFNVPLEICGEKSQTATALTELVHKLEEPELKG